MELFCIFSSAFIALILLEFFIGEKSLYSKVKIILLFSLIIYFITGIIFHFVSEGYFNFDFSKYTVLEKFKIHTFQITLAVSLVFLYLIYKKFNKKELLKHSIKILRNKNFYISLVIKFLLIMILFILFNVINWIPITFGNVNYEQIIFTLSTKVSSTESSVLESFFKDCVFNSVGVSLLYLIFTEVILIFFNYCMKIILTFKSVKIKKVKLYLSSYKFFQILYYFILVMLILLTFNVIGESIGYFDYMEYKKLTSDLYENYYVDAEDVKFVFPENKRNLIYINIESLETSLLDKESGGLFDENYIPKLTDIAFNNHSFYLNENIEGFTQMHGTGWTAGGITSQLLGIPINIPIDGNSYGEDGFMPGAFGIGDILKKENYNTLAIMGSDSNFGNRKQLFSDHGQFDIIDHSAAMLLNYIKNGYSLWWGFEDAIVYDIAKEELNNLSSENNPFFLYILTADTHFPDGLLDTSCSNDKPSHLLSVYDCADRMIVEFVEYLKQQEFYENTTIVIAGDHLSMNTSVFPNVITSNENSNRKGYFTIINSPLENNNNLDRKYTSFDIFPTTLSSLNVTWDSNRLSLGTNLYSHELTLIEELGFTFFENELKKNSEYYNENILKNN